MELNFVLKTSELTNKCNIFVFIVNIEEKFTLCKTTLCMAAGIIYYASPKHCLHFCANNFCEDIVKI